MVHHLITQKVENVMETLEKFDFEKSGNEILYNGITGKQMSTKIFIGPTYYQRLKHMVEDKVHSRATGPKMRVPIGSLLLSMTTAAFLSNLM